MVDIRSARLTHRIALGVVPAVLAGTVCASTAEAQRWRSWPAREITLQVGGFSHDNYGDEMSPMVALRTSWRVREWLVTEFGGMYTRLERADETAVNMTGLDLGIQAEAPVTVLRPYVGFATGIHATYEGEGGARYFAPSTQALAGLRLRLPAGLGLRGEARYQLDQQEDGPIADNVELTGGITWSWR